MLPPDAGSMGAGICTSVDCSLATTLMIMEPAFQPRDEQSLVDSAEPLTIPTADRDDIAYTQLQVHGINLQARPPFDVLAGGSAVSDFIYLSVAV